MTHNSYGHLGGRKLVSYLCPFDRQGGLMTDRVSNGIISISDKRTVTYSCQGCVFEAESSGGGKWFLSDATYPKARSMGSFFSLMACRDVIRLDLKRQRAKEHEQAPTEPAP